jgi:hypothetical protein
VPLLVFVFVLSIGESSRPCARLLVGFARWSGARCFVLGVGSDSNDAGGQLSALESLASFFFGAVLRRSAAEALVPLFWLRDLVWFSCWYQPLLHPQCTVRLSCWYQPLPTCVFLSQALVVLAARIALA